METDFRILRIEALRSIKFSLRDLSFAFCDLPFAVAAFIVFTAFIVFAFGAIVTLVAFIETGAYALLRKLLSMSHNGFARTSLCHTCVASFHIARRTRTHNVSGGIA